MTQSLFNTQQLLFKQPPITSKKNRIIPHHYYQHGWAIINNVASPEDALTIQQDFIHSIDPHKVALHARFHQHIQLAKADQIPVCDDIVATSFQVLHFDMGHPLLESNDQLLVTHVGIYLPSDTRHTVTAKTRLVELKGLLQNHSLTPKSIEGKITEYVRKHGDGWHNHNTYRLACFARFIDALADQPQLKKDIDKTVGQWFQNRTKLGANDAHQQEQAFYAQHGINLPAVEQQIALKPGQLLILDNTRLIHGRIGHRKAKELYNFMFGVQAITHADIAALRQNICRQLTASTSPPAVAYQ